MTIGGSSLLSDPQPCSHIVYPYTDENRVADAVTLFATAGLRKGEAVVLVMTAEHCDPIRAQIADKGFDLAALEASGQLVCADAAELLSTFMAGNMPDEKKFFDKIAGIIERAKASTSGESQGRVRIFGEMVSLLWISNTPAALRLEELWNDVVKAHSISLLCTYALGGTALAAFPDALMNCHSHAIA